MGNGDLQGWHADPFGRHEERYFSAGQPTSLVRDGSTEGHDDPSAGNGDPAAAISMEAAAPAAPGPGGSMPAGPHGAASDAYLYSRAANRTRRRRRSGVLAGSALVVVAAVIGALVVANKSEGLSPVAFVQQSAQQTIAQHTADMTLSVNVQFAGQSLAMNGTGQLNFSADAMALDVTGDEGGQLFDMKEILVNGTLYVAFLINGQNPVAPEGSTWSQMAVPKSSSAGSIGDPYTMLSQIEQGGSTLRPLGTKVIDGVTCTGYDVTPPGDGGPAATVTVWADSQRLVREISADMQISVAGSSEQATMTLDFSNFGVPVHIKAPPPDTTYAA